MTLEPGKTYTHVNYPNVKYFFIGRKEDGNLCFEDEAGRIIIRRKAEESLYEEYIPLKEMYCVFINSTDFTPAISSHNKEWCETWAKNRKKWDQTADCKIVKMREVR